MPSAEVGKFLWHELVTADPGAAGAFYGKVLGWTPQAWDKDPSYTVLLSPKGPVGGMMRPGADAHGSSAHWVNYVGTANVDETAASAQRLGGRVLKGASDIPGGGRYAVLADPQGAVFGVYTPSATGTTGQAADAFTWHELASSDHAASLRFYRELFGWEQVAVHDMGAPVGPYVIFGRGGQQLGGMFSRQGGAQWLAYARVSSASKAAESAKAAGGRVNSGPMQVPGGSWVAQLADPHGAAIAVNQPAGAESAQPAAKPAAQPPKPVAKPAPAPAATARPAATAPSPAPASPAAPKPAAAAPAASAPRPAAAPPAAAPKPAAVVAHPSAPAKPAQPAKPSAPPKAAAPAKTAAPAKAAPKKKAAAPAKKAARKTAARKPAAKKKKTARPARKAAAKKRTKKASAARTRRGSGKRSAARGGKRAGARKAARGKRAKRAK